ncbi:MAG: beta-N-acetylhexosaminidase, partial [Pedobacter sp.]
MVLLHVLEIKAVAPLNQVSLIPQPVKIEALAGTFKLNSSTKLISTSANKEIAELFAAMFKAPTGFNLQHAFSGSTGIQLSISKTPNALLGNEGYTLHVTPTKINIVANKPAGLFYGMQTLMQLLPKEIESPLLVKNKSWSVPCVKITDYPRFGWRGLMLDVSRHYFDKGMVKKYINQLAKYKMNVFHWHLTDDQGWRIEIKSLPKLTEIGAWRAPRVGLWWTP